MGELSKNVQLQQKPVIKAKLLSCTKNRTLVMCMFSNINISMQCVQCVLLFLVLAVNSAQFQILCSYTLLLKSPALMHPQMTHSFHISDSQIPVAKSAHFLGSIMNMFYSSSVSGFRKLERAKNFRLPRPLPTRKCVYDTRIYCRSQLVKQLEVRTEYL